MWEVRRNGEYPRFPSRKWLWLFDDIDMQLLLNEPLKENLNMSESKKLTGRFRSQWKYYGSPEMFMKFLQWKRAGEPETHDPVLDRVVARYLRWKNAPEVARYLAQYPIHQARQLLCKLVPEGKQWSTNLEVLVDWLKEVDEDRIRSSFKKRFGHLSRADLDRLQNDVNYIPQGMVSVRTWAEAAIKRAEEELQQTKKEWEKLIQLSVEADHHSTKNTPPRGLEGEEEDNFPAKRPRLISSNAHEEEPSSGGAEGGVEENEAVVLLPTNTAHVSTSIAVSPADGEDDDGASNYHHHHHHDDDGGDKNCNHEDDGDNNNNHDDADDDGHLCGIQSSTLGRLRPLLLEEAIEAEECAGSGVQEQTAPTPNNDLSVEVVVRQCSGLLVRETSTTDMPHSSRLPSLSLPVPRNESLDESNEPQHQQVPVLQSVLPVPLVMGTTSSTPKKKRNLESILESSPSSPSSVGAHWKWVWITLYEVISTLAFTSLVCRVTRLAVVGGYHLIQHLMDSIWTHWNEDKSVFVSAGQAVQTLVGYLDRVLVPISPKRDPTMVVVCVVGIIVLVWLPGIVLGMVILMIRAWLGRSTS